MIDLHTHILPGVDDGSPDDAISLNMAWIASESGVRTIVATPHANQVGRYENYDSSDLRRRFEHLRELIAKEDIPIDIVEGMEIFAAPGVGELIRQKKLFGINRGPYHLVEFPFDAEIWWIEDRIEELLEIDAIPLIAHVERYYCVQKHPERVYTWIKNGCYTQINKASVFGRFGRREKKTSERLLDYDLVTCVASDTHSDEFRTTWMSDIRAFLKDRYDEEYMLQLVRNNPRRILEGRYIPPHGKSFRRHRFL